MIPHQEYLAGRDLSGEQKRCQWLSLLRRLLGMTEKFVAAKKISLLLTQCLSLVTPDSLDGPNILPIDHRIGDWHTLQVRRRKIKQDILSMPDFGCVLGEPPDSVFDRRCESDADSPGKKRAGESRQQQGKK